MIEQRVEVVNELGLHLRAAARIVALTSASPARVHIRTDEVEVDGKSLLGITSLLARQGTVVTVCAEGEGETEIVDAVVQLIAGGFAP